ncbi:sugar phosphate phosphatase [Ligilactobacillus salitolerans]|uniref:Sugar phosphate phosphatase n=1 Tax=Ligilactobacillus salitolerans TaxID=1808352 RepID=A0A401IU83_9LACO|nr:Cof-type HAD-IIB family hydrolase [Ligilactobacillus salitolerans]GBG95057.1 sugar phosphate phosphatase [Ligilactobacillus salitolerans]
MSINLVAIDIDNTLLTSAPERKLTPANITAIQHALDLGVKIVLCSARPLAGVKRYLDQAQISGDDQYVIVDNGALVQTATGQTIATHLLDSQTVQELVRFSQTHQLHYNVIAEDSTMCTTNARLGAYTVQLAAKYQAPLQVFANQEDFASLRFAKFGLTDDPELLDRFEPELKQRFGSTHYVVRSRPFLLEVMHKDANKGTALESLAEKLALQKDELLAIGDEQNDLPMFAAAGTGAAMGNAVPAVKEAADYVTADNDHSGVAQALHKLILDA